MAPSAGLSAGLAQPVYRETTTRARLRNWAAAALVLCLAGCPSNRVEEQSSAQDHSQAVSAPEAQSAALGAAQSTAARDWPWLAERAVSHVHEALGVLERHRDAPERAEASLREWLARTQDERRRVQQENRAHAERAASSGLTAERSAIEQLVHDQLAARHIAQRTESLAPLFAARPALLPLFASVLER